jgi:hypothetical protein
MGWLSDQIDRTRMFVDEPSVNAKYSDSELIDLLEAEWTTIMQEQSRVSQAPVVCRHDFTFQSGQQHYVLPPTVGEILTLGEHDTTSDIMSSPMVPRSRYNPAGPNFTIEGNVIRLDPKWTGASATIRLTYIPTGDVRLHQGSVATPATDIVDGTDSATVVLAASPTTGTLDTRVNAYEGSVLRILTASTNNYIQERVISAYDVTTRKATVKPGFDYTPGGAAVTYEIAPLLHLFRGLLVSLATARVISGVEGDRGRYQTLTQLWQEKMRALRLHQTNMQTIVGQRMETDTIYNNRTSTVVRW